MGGFQVQRRAFRLLHGLPAPSVGWLHLWAKWRDLEIGQSHPGARAGFRRRPSRIAASEDRVLVYGMSPFTEDELRRWKDYLVGRSQRLAKQNCHYLFVIAPEKN